MTGIMQDAVSSKERLNPPSRLMLWMERRYYQQKLDAARQAMQAAEALVVYAKNDVTQCRAHLYEVQDTMRLRGFQIDLPIRTYPVDKWMALASLLIASFATAMAYTAWPVLSQLLVSWSH